MPQVIKQSYTPGPWTHHLGGSVRVCDGRHDSFEGCRAIAEAEILNVPRAEAVANARLIAAAPELLAAIKALAGAHHGWHLGMGRCICAAHEDALAVIAKAEGR